MYISISAKKFKLLSFMESEFETIIKGQICPYCKCGTRLVAGDVVYPHLTTTTPRPLFLDKMFWQCVENVDHFVGTHKDNVTAFGRVADRELRNWKNQGHQVFDPLWKSRRYFRRQSDAYVWLSEKMALPLEHTHFGMFSVEQCKAAISFCRALSGSSTDSTSGLEAR